MKYLLISLMLLTQVSYAQLTNRKVDIGNTARTRPLRLLSDADRAFREGVDLAAIWGIYPTNYKFDGVQTPELNGATAPVSFSSVPSGVGVQGGIGVPMGAAFYITSVSGWVSAPTFIQVALGNNGGVRTVVSGNFTVPVQKFIAGLTDQVNVAVLGRVTGTDKVLLTYQVDGYQVSNDFDTDADASILILGDSNTQGTSLQGGTHRDDIWHWQLKRFLNLSTGLTYRNGANRTRIIEKALKGQSTIYIDRLRASGRLNVNPSLIVNQMGGNDGANLTTYTNNINRLIAWKKAYYPLVPMIICGVGPRSSGTQNETDAVALRGAAQTAVANNADPTITYCNLGAAFTNTDDTFYTSDGSDGTVAGNRSHWNLAGQIKIGEAIRDHIIANNIRLIWDY